mmetsp:Transcript_16831/g.52550  ORF Transcript_16831/g.52550 Transcript_16831/m.52550 type:complete len:232 (-) Transcript_16831:496-1191(-)
MRQSVRPPQRVFSVTTAGPLATAVARPRRGVALSGRAPAVALGCGRITRLPPLPRAGRGGPQGARRAAIEGPFFSCRVFGQPDVDARQWRGRRVPGVLHGPHFADRGPAFIRCVRPRAAQALRARGAGVTRVCRAPRRARVPQEHPAHFGAVPGRRGGAPGRPGRRRARHAAVGSGRRVVGGEARRRRFGASAARRRRASAQRRCIETAGFVRCLGRGHREGVDRRPERRL